MFYRNKIIIFSECGSDTERYKVGNVIKDAITAETMTMNIKHGSIITERVYAGLIFFSNYDRPFKLDEGDRRFFVTRCNWTKEYADKLKEQGYFDELSNFYNDEENIHGLYHYLMNHDIKTNCKGDAPITKAKELMMDSEINEVECFFKKLKLHPCKYWNISMIDQFFDKEFDMNKRMENSKQYNHFIRNCQTLPVIKINQKSVRLKCFDYEQSIASNEIIRENIKKYWSEFDFTKNNKEIF